MVGDGSREVMTDSWKRPSCRSRVVSFRISFIRLRLLPFILPVDYSGNTERLFVNPNVVGKIPFSSLPFCLDRLPTSYRQKTLVFN
jgi:hypothetical protein